MSQLLPQFYSWELLTLPSLKACPIFAFLFKLALITFCPPEAWLALFKVFIHFLTSYVYITVPIPSSCAYLTIPFYEFPYMYFWLSHIMNSSTYGWLRHVMSYPALECLSYPALECLMFWVAWSLTCPHFAFLYMTANNMSTAYLSIWSPASV
jgi:hypothetical protein